MAEKYSLTRERLKELLHYNPNTGVFKWRIYRGGHGGKARLGAVAGCKSNGYLVIGLERQQYGAHQLAALYMTGEFAINVDHKFGNGLDNRWCNLRPATVLLNRQNQRKTKSNSVSGLMGAFFDKRCGRWFSTIRVDGKRMPLGRFDTAQQAHAAYITAKRRLHPGCTI